MLADVEGTLTRSRPRSAVTSGIDMAAGLASEQSAIRRNAEPVDVQRVDEQRWYEDGT
ncbi:hypothetical protein [Streptomyces sp. NBC_00046]|uniref:hypothetical protein n=1 Tax=unclassified Streptomyces TaxID=2593676 RepID=UPI0032511E9C